MERKNDEGWHVELEDYVAILIICVYVYVCVYVYKFFSYNLRIDKSK